MLCPIPFDVWIMIMSVLSVKQIVHLSAVRLTLMQLLVFHVYSTCWQTCKLLNRITNEKSVWLSALHDILDVIPSPHILHLLLRMSTSQLKQRVARMVQMEEARRTRTFTAVEGHIHYIHRDGIDVVDVKVLPGGQWIVAVFENGEVHLRAWDGVANISGPLAEAPLSIYRHYHFDMCLAFTTSGIHWVAVRSDLE